MRRPSEPDEPARKPEACPFCQSRAVGTLAKVITSETYWRCQACGEVWNPARLGPTPPARRPSSW